MDIQTKIRRKWREVVYLGIVFLVILVTQDFLREYIVFNRELAIVEDELLDDVNQEVKSLVETTNNVFQYVLVNLDQQMIEVASDQMNDISVATDTFVLTNPGEEALTIQNEVIYITQMHNDLDLNHLHSVYNTDGLLILDGDSNTVVNTSMMDAVDSLNRQYIRLLIDQFQANPDQDAYLFINILVDDVLEEVLIYGHLVTDTNLFITTEISTTEFTEMEKMRALEGVQHINVSDKNSVYILTGDGTILYHQNEQAIGLSPADSTYPLWQTTLQYIVDFVDAGNEGFLHYNFYSNYENGVVTEKVAYIQYIEEWDLIIGASADRDLYDDLLAQYVLVNYRSVFFIKIPAYIILFAIVILVFRLNSQNVRFSQKIFEEEKSLYQKFANLTKEIIMIADKQGRIIFTNKPGSDVIYGERKEKVEIYFDQIMVEEEGYYILYGIRKDMFVKFITEEIDFNNELADLYIITDVTEKINTERKLEALSMKDDLTMLGNRRLMLKDYNDTVLPYVKNAGNAHIIMIDLDDFKPANDMYGHSFGDNVLAEIAKMFRANADQNIRFYRIGGDEFAIMIIGLSDEEVVTFLQDIQQQIGAFDYGKPVAVGFSAGVARIEVSEHRQRFSDFYDLADRLLYESKAKGKNTITI